MLGFRFRVRVFRNNATSDKQHVGITPTRDTLKTLARALIQPHFVNRVHVWYRDAPQSLKNKLQTAQNKLVRLLLNLPSRAHLTANHFINMGWLLFANTTPEAVLQITSNQDLAPRKVQTPPKLGTPYQ